MSLLSFLLLVRIEMPLYEREWMRELVESEEGHSEVEKVEEVEEILELVETKQDAGFEAGGRVGDTQEYLEGDIGIKHKCNELDKS